jgi:hypothetical protein
MKTTELYESIVTWIFYGLSALLLIAVIRYPKATFIDIPVYIIKSVLHIDTALDIAGVFRGKNLRHEIKTIRKRFLTFAKASKFLLINDTDEPFLRKKITEGLETTDEQITADAFRFIIVEQKTIVIPPSGISFNGFNYLVQWMSEFKLHVVGIVETKRIAYTVYKSNDEEMDLIGETDKGEKFFISLEEDFTKRQFLRVSKNIETVEENYISKIRQVVQSSSVGKNEIDNPAK